AHVKKTSGADIRNGISVDQVAAEEVGHLTRFPSLQLGIDGGGGTGDCDSGYSCAYARNISWSGPSTPLAKVTEPRAVYDRIFAGFDAAISQAEAEKRRLFRRSVLDVVRADLSALQTSVGARDRQKLDEYATGIRELE